MKYIYLLCLTGMMCYACTGQQKEQENQEFSVSGDTIIVSSESPIAKKLKISEVQKELHETTFTVSGIVKAIPNHYAEIASPFAGPLSVWDKKWIKAVPCLKSVRPTFLKPEKSTIRQSRKWNWLPRICAANRTCMHTK